MSLGGMFKCPQCKRIHVANIEDEDELQCTDNATSQIKSDEVKKNTVLEGNGWNFNHFSTKENVYRNASIKDVSLIKEIKMQGNIKNY